VKTVNELYAEAQATITKLYAAAYGAAGKHGLEIGIGTGSHRAN
jgi:hypothetical protein